MNKFKNYILFFIGLAILAYIVYSIGFNKILNVFRQANYIYLIHIFVFFALAQAIRILKWKLLGQKIDMSLAKGHLDTYYLQTRVMGLITPFRSGEILPLFFEEKDRSKFFSITLVDRYHESFATLAIGVFTFYFYFRSFIKRSSVVLLILFVVALVLFVWLFGTKNGYLVISSFIDKRKEKKSGTKFLNSLEKALNNLKNMLNIKSLLLMFVLTLAATSLDIIVYFYIFRIIGINFTITQAAISMVFLSLVSSLSPTPSGVGISDAGYLVFSQNIAAISFAKIESSLILLRVLPVAMLLLMISFLKKILKTRSLNKT